jgi:hypothetical protein
MTEEELKHYAQRKREIHEDAAREQRAYSAVNLLRAKQASEALRRLKDRQ